MSPATPVPPISAANRSALWTGNVTIPSTAGGGGSSPVAITFYTASDDGSRLWIDGNLVVDNDFNQGVTQRQGTVNLVPGSTHQIQIGYYQAGGGAGMFAYWNIGDGNGQVFIPASAFTYGNAEINQAGSGTLEITGTLDITPKGLVNANAGTVDMAGTLVPPPRSTPTAAP